MTHETGPSPAWPYAAGPWGTPPTPRPPYDERSVASLLLLGTVLAAPASVWLGVRGIRATRDGERRGRWCAVLGVVGGILVILVLVGGLFLRGPVDRLLDPVGEVVAGDCVDVRVVERTFEAWVEDRPCNEPHDAEVVHRGRLDVFQAAELLDDSAAELCRPLLGERYQEEMATGRYSMRVILLGEPGEASGGEEFLCLAGDVDGGRLRSAIGVSA